MEFRTPDPSQLARRPCHHPWSARRTFDSCRPPRRGVQCLACTHSEAPLRQCAAVCHLAGLARLNLNGFLDFWALSSRSPRALQHTYLRFCAATPQWGTVLVNALPWPVGSGALERTISIRSHGMGMVVAQMSIGMFSIYVWKYEIHLGHVSLACHDLM